MIKEIQALKQKKNRDASGLFFIEGEKYVSEIPKEWDIVYFVISESSKSSYNFTERAPVHIIKDSLYERVSDTKSPQGIMAVLRKKTHCAAQLMLKESPFLILAEELNDPGNLGTIIRTAHACGADAVILSENSVDAYSPKVLRASAGSFFHIPVIPDTDLFAFADKLKSKGIKITAAHARGRMYPYDMDFKENAVLLIGNEAHGLSDRALKLADAAVCLPMPGGAESLNASVACSVLMYEVIRQRWYLC